MNRVIGPALGAAILLAVAASAFGTYVAWEHNPQGEFHEVDAAGTTIVHWIDLLIVGGAWFGYTLGGLCVAVFNLIGVVTLVRRLMARA